MPIVIFLIGIAAETASPFSSSHAPMDHVFLRGLCLRQTNNSTQRQLLQSTTCAALGETRPYILKKLIRQKEQKKF